MELKLGNTSIKIGEIVISVCLRPWSV